MIKQILQWTGVVLKKILKVAWDWSLHHHYWRIHTSNARRLWPLLGKMDNITAWQSTQPQIVMVQPLRKNNG